MLSVIANMNKSSSFSNGRPCKQIFTALFYLSLLFGDIGSEDIDPEKSNLGFPAVILGVVARRCSLVLSGVSWIKKDELFVFVETSIILLEGSSMELLPIFFCVSQTLVERRRQWRIMDLEMCSVYCICRKKGTSRRSNPYSVWRHTDGNNK